ncbi:FUSC family protein [Clostridium intestinale]|uniref:Transmembrane protein n=1 Tax=Clostridium intestinale URNW TaxID=1294142 RepID=U2NHZ6_9CLOT|nr:aromatic acid exporter family protein [Clostridium intestinale]ERK28486.1 hypothetical protein CINTURNW_4514 [Clostridium intestinale URNW]WRY50309.1 aromatic acid exporter family protein [Clostridium intestinale]
MNFKINKLPKIGLRNLKTALSVLACILLFEILNRELPFYACIAAVICTGDSVKNSVLAGKNRLIGTLIGGLHGILFIFIEPYIPIPTSVLISLGIVIVIYTGVILKKQPSISISCVVFLAIMINIRGGVTYLYAINRIIDTAIGIVIAVLVNKYFNPTLDTDGDLDEDN